MCFIFIWIMRNNCLSSPFQVVITKCYHLFCHPCVQRIIESRHRKCPVCTASFGPNDVKPVYIWWRLGNFVICIWWRLGNFVICRSSMTHSAPSGNILISLGWWFSQVHMHNFRDLLRNNDDRNPIIPAHLAIKIVIDFAWVPNSRFHLYLLL